MTDEVVFCTNCLGDIFEDEMYFEAENRKGLKVILCRFCFMESDCIPDEMKQHFMEHEEVK